MADDHEYDHKVEIDDDSYQDSDSESESESSSSYSESSSTELEQIVEPVELVNTPSPEVSAPLDQSPKVPKVKKNDSKPSKPSKKPDTVDVGPLEDDLFLEGSLLTHWGKGATSFQQTKTFCRLADMTFYAYTKSTSSHPRKFLDCEKLKDLRPGNPSLFEFKLIDTNDKEYKIRAISQDDFNLWVKAFQAVLARRQRATNRTVKVWFMDISKLSVVIERGVTTAEDLWWLVCESMNLANESRDAFFIWIMGANLEVLLCNDDIITNVLEDWHENFEKRYSDKLEGPPRLVFRTTPMLTLSQERNMKDAKAIHLFYLQAAYNVLYGNYIINQSQAVVLAGLAAQIRLGDFDRNKHRPGYIANSIRRYIPFYLQKKHKMKPDKWEFLIAAEHQSHAGKSMMIAQMLYLQRIRTIPYYGSIFFYAKNRDKSRESGYWSQMTDGTICIGVNMEGIHVIKERKYLHSYTWSNISHWEVEQGKYFYFSALAVKPGKGTHKKPHTYLLETKSAPLIKETLQDIVFDLKKQERVVNRIRKEQSKTTIEVTKEFNEAKPKKSLKEKHHEPKIENAQFDPSLAVPH